MRRVLHVTPVRPYKLNAEFDDGISGVVDLSGSLWGPMFEPLRDYAYFSRVTIDEFGAICWPNGADLAPDALYDTLRTATSVAAL